MIKEAIGSLVQGRSLTLGESASVMEEIMEGKVTPAQLGAFLTALRIKGETAEEIAGLASVMRAKAMRVVTDGPVLDIVGTGGDGANTFNISTTAAFVIAAAGVKVAKHGNRAATSRCGSADVLEALGVTIALTPEQVKLCIDEVGIGFMFAPVFHPAMKYAGATRKEIGIRTVFNILGPLTNPAGAAYQVVGVPGEEIGEKIARALGHLRIKHGLVVHGLDGLDELSVCGTSVLWEINEGESEYFRRYITPEDLGFERASIKAIEGGTPAENAGLLRSVLAGERTPRRDVVLMNAAAALYTAGKVKTFTEGAVLAGEAVDNGSALAKLEQLIAFSKKLGETK